MHYRIILHPRQGTEQLGGFWTDLIGIGGAIAGPTAAQAGLPNWASTAVGVAGQVVAGLINKPKAPHPASSQGEIAGIVDQIFAQYHQLERSGISTQDLLGGAHQLRALLDDPQLFKAGSTDAYLTQAKGDADHAITVLQGKLGTQTPATGGTGTTTSDAGSGISSTAILALGAAAIGIGLLTAE